MNSSGFSMNSAIIRISTERVIESASEISSSQAGIGRIRTVRMAMTPRASAISPRRRNFSELFSDAIAPPGLAAPTAPAGPLAFAVSAMMLCQAQFRQWRARRRPCEAGTGTPSSLYCFSLLRRVRIEMPRMFAAWVRLPRQCCSVSMIRSRSTVGHGLADQPRRRATLAADVLDACGRDRGRDRQAAPAGEQDRLRPDHRALHSSTARCMVFSSSRTLPRQAWARRMS